MNDFNRCLQFGFQVLVKKEELVEEKEEEEKKEKVLFVDVRKGRVRGLQRWVFSVKQEFFKEVFKFIVIFGVLLVFIFFEIDFEEGEFSVGGGYFSFGEFELLVEKMVEEQVFVEEKREEIFVVEEKKELELVLEVKVEEIKVEEFKVEEFKEEFKVEEFKEELEEKLKFQVEFEKEEEFVLKLGIIEMVKFLVINMVGEMIVQEKVEQDEEKKMVEFVIVEEK